MRKKSTKSKAKIIYFLYSSQNFVTHENSTDFRMREKYLCIGKACDEKHFRSGRRRDCVREALKNTLHFNRSRFRRFGCAGRRTMTTAPDVGYCRT